MKNKLAKRLRDIGVVQRKRVILTSGKISDLYVDLKKAYGYPDILELICKCIKPGISGATCVAGIGHGGVPLATAVSLKNKLKLCLVREKPRKHGTGAWIDGHVPDKKDRVLVVDDVITTGGSIRKVLSVLKKTRARVIGCAVVVRREDVRLGIPMYCILDIDDLA